jgi:O-methyltransferase
MRMGAPTPQQMYLDLLKRCLVNWVYLEAETRPVLPRKLAYILEAITGGLRLTLPSNIDPEKRKLGADWPVFGHSMIGLKRLENIQYCIEDVLKNSVPGDFLETGVWRGGSCIFMRGMLKVYGITDRKVWVCDSFKGLPIPNVIKYPADRKTMFFLARSLVVSLETVKANFDKYGLLDDQVVFAKGWFRDTLPTLPVEQIAVLRLDGDMYESTIDALSNLYPRLSEGGYVIIDDYAIPACRSAVHDYRGKNRISDKIVEQEGTVTFWKKEREQACV